MRRADRKFRGGATKAVSARKSSLARRYRTNLCTTSTRTRPIWTNSRTFSNRPTHRRRSATRFTSGGPARAGGGRPRKSATPSQRHLRTRLRRRTGPRTTSRLRSRRAALPRPRLRRRRHSAWLPSSPRRRRDRSFDAPGDCLRRGKKSEYLSSNHHEIIGPPALRCKRKLSYASQPERCAAAARSVSLNPRRPPSEPDRGG
mmetsp:Transcript_21116/g.68309  ORF Transcript_21116/g.68309 Transcript_21116/m.68309 type:complete len:202 (-) Transcript_21116:1031-1636(-)